MKGMLIICGLGLLAMLMEAVKIRRGLLLLVLTGLAAAYVLNVYEWREQMSIAYFDNMIFFDRTAIAFSGIIILTAFLWFILAQNYFTEESSRVDHFVLVLFALVGALMLTAYRNMITLFLGIEIMSIPMYVLAASRKQDIRSNEAGFKYLLTGAFMSAVLLFGMALIYGASGTFDINVLKGYITSEEVEIPLFFYAGVIMMFAAMCFKIAAAPFHFWAPDVYEGSPTLITALMSTVVKTAAFAAFMRLFMFVLGDVSIVWTGVLAGVIALSLVVANFTAAMQTSVKRMLAYSSISHAAFMLMVVLANDRTNISLNALIYYSLAYSIGSIVAFGVLYQVNRAGGETYESFNGLGKRHPLLALCMTVAMLSLAGIPIAAGFFAKYFVFSVLIGSGYLWLLILGVITSAVAAYYYLKVIIAMYFKPSEATAPVVVESSGITVIAIATLITLVLGIAPGYVAGMFAF